MGSVMARAHDINQELCRMLGINDQYVTGFDLRARAGELPTVYVTRLLGTALQARHQTRRFMLRLVEDKPDLATMDAEFRQGIAERLDPLVADAQRRLAQSLDDDVARHLAQMRARRVFRREPVWSKA